MARPTQKEKILQYLLKNNSVTSLTLQEEFNIVDPRARIRDLRDEGFVIRTARATQIDNRGRKHTHLGKYTLMAIKPKGIEAQRIAESLRCTQGECQLINKDAKR